MIRTINLLVIFLLSTSFSFAQQDIEIEVLFLKGKKEIEYVQYYVVKENDAYLLSKKGNKIFLNNTFLIDDNKDLTILAVNKKDKVEFTVEHKVIKYLTVTRMSFNFRYFLKRVYRVNQGLDYDEIVKQSKKKYNFIE